MSRMTLWLSDQATEVSRLYLVTTFSARKTIFSKPRIAALGVQVGIE